MIVGLWLSKLCGRIGVIFGIFSLRKLMRRLRMFVFLVWFFIGCLSSG